MRVYLFIIYFLILCALSIYGQGPVYQWAVRFGNANNDRDYKLERDIPGNLYVSGIANNGNFIRKYSPNGTMTWSITTYAYDFMVDPASNVYAFGMFGGTIDADPGPGVATICTNFLSHYLFL